MFYVVNNYLINLYVLSNKAVGPGKNPKLINVGPMSIPESRVYLNLIDKQRPYMQVKRNSRILNNRPSLQLKQGLTG